MAWSITALRPRREAVHRRWGALRPRSTEGHDAGCAAESGQAPADGRQAAAAVLRRVSPPGLRTEHDHRGRSTHRRVRAIISPMMTVGRDDAACHHHKTHRNQYLK